MTTIAITRGCGRGAGGRLLGGQGKGEGQQGEQSGQETTTAQTHLLFLLGLIAGWLQHSRSYI
jgi:hypothetical protein